MKRYTKREDELIANPRMSVATLSYCLGRTKAAITHRRWQLWNRRK